jgi:hypothetical protein
MDRVLIEIIGQDDIPAKQLENQLTIGAIGCDIELTHPQIQGNQLSVFMEDGVISLVSHSNEVENLLNDRPLPLEKKIILLENDEVRIGPDIVVNFRRDLAQEQSSEAGSEFLLGDDDEEELEQETIAPVLDEGESLDLGEDLNLGQEEEPEQEELVQEEIAQDEVVEEELVEQEDTSVEEPEGIDPLESLDLSGVESDAPEELSQEDKTQNLVQEEESLPPLPSENTLKIDIPKELEESLESTNSEAEEKTQILTADILAQSDEEQEQQEGGRADEAEEMHTENISLSDLTLDNISAPEKTGMIQEKVEQTETAQNEAKAPIKEKTDLNNIDAMVKKGQAASKDEDEAQTSVREIKTLTSIKRPKVKKKKAKKLALGGDIIAPPLLIRFFAFLIDIQLAYFCMREFLIPFELSSLLEPLVELQTFALAEVSRLANYPVDQLIDFKRLLPVASLYLLLRLVFNLIFGLSLGQLLLGMRPESNLGWMRIGGLIREIFGYLTGPLLVLDAPAIFGKKSIKEMLLFCPLGIRSKLFSYLLLLIVLPAVTGATFFMPVFTNLNIVKTPFVYQTKAISSPRSNQVGSEIIESEFFQLTKNRSSTEKFLVFTDFELIRKKKKKIYLPALKVRDIAGKQTYSFKKLTNFKMDKLLAPLAASYPAVKIKFPRVHKMFEEKDRFIFTQEFEQEFKDIIAGTLNLDKTQVLDHAIKFGPFFQAFFEMKKVFKDTLDSNFERVDFIKINDRPFVRFWQKRKRAGKERVEQYLMSMNSYRGSIYQLTYTGTDKQAEQVFYRDFLQGVQWNDELQFSLKRVNRKKPFNTYQVFDVYLSSNVKPHHREKLVKYVYTSFYETGLLIHQLNDEELKQDFINSTNNFLVLINQLNKSNRKTDDTPLVLRGFDLLIKNLNELVEALVNNNGQYFGLTS